MFSLSQSNPIWIIFINKGVPIFCRHCSCLDTFVCISEVIGTYICRWNGYCNKRLMHFVFEMCFYYTFAIKESHCFRYTRSHDTKNTSTIYKSLDIGFGWKRSSRGYSAEANMIAIKYEDFEHEILYGMDMKLKPKPIQWR